MARGVNHTAVGRGIHHFHGVTDPAKAEAARGISDIGELPRQTFDQSDFKCLCHGHYPEISATVLPRLAAISSGVRNLAKASIVARTTLIGFRDP